MNVKIRRTREESSGAIPAICSQVVQRKSRKRETNVSQHDYQISLRNIKKSSVWQSVRPSRISNDLRHGQQVYCWDLRKSTARDWDCWGDEQLSYFVSPSRSCRGKKRQFWHLHMMSDVTRVDKIVTVLSTSRANGSGPHCQSGCMQGGSRWLRQV